jgi:hypothetical protein
VARPCRYHARCGERIEVLALVARSRESGAPSAACVVTVGAGRRDRLQHALMGDCVLRSVT